MHKKTHAVSIGHLATPDSLAGPSSKARSMTKPDTNTQRKLLCWAAFIFMLGSIALGPAMALGQSTGSAPVFGATVQGQSASTVEGTFANVVNYVGNVICPIGAALMVAATVVQVKNGKSWVPTGVTAGGLLAVSGITRLIESMVMNGQAAVH
jgi:hypothetical protein